MKESEKYVEVENWSRIRHHCSRGPPTQAAANVSLRALHKRLNSNCQY